MKIYHSSSVKVIKPDTRHSRDFLDFGKGFYVTSIEEQAIKYAERLIRVGKEAVMNIYDLRDGWKANYKVKIFEAYDDEWLDFVVANRDGEKVEMFDAVEGGIADDKVFEAIDLYTANLIDKGEALRRLKFEKPNHQICFLNQEIIDNYISFEQCVMIRK